MSENNKQIIRMPQVEKRLGLSRYTVYRLIKSDGFPKPIQLGRQAVGWYEHEVDKWIASRPRAA